jgi:chromosome segregation ATPase
VVDDVNEARQLCYESPDHHKVVSADGTLFKPNGNITGVRTGRAAGRVAVQVKAANSASSCASTCM